MNHEIRIDRDLTEPIDIWEHVPCVLTIICDNLHFMINLVAIICYQFSDWWFPTVEDFWVGRARLAFNYLSGQKGRSGLLVPPTPSCRLTVFRCSLPASLERVDTLLFTSPKMLPVAKSMLFWDSLPFKRTKLVTMEFIVSFRRFWRVY